MNSQDICRAQRKKEKIIRWAKGELESLKIRRVRLGRAALKFCGSADLKAFLGEPARGSTGRGEEDDDDRDSTERR